MVEACPRVDMAFGTDHAFIRRLLRTVIKGGF